jgi:hypothetical protein
LEENQEVVRLSLFQYIHEKIQYSHDKKNLLLLNNEKIEINDNIDIKINENKIKNLINKYEKNEKNVKNESSVLSMNEFIFTVSIHGYMVLSDRPVWERFAYGYKRESDVCTAAEKYEKYLSFKNKKIGIDDDIVNNDNNDNTLLSYLRYSNSLEAIYGGIKELKNIKNLKKNMKNHKISNNMKNKINKYIPEAKNNHKNDDKVQTNETYNNENMEQPSLMWIDIDFNEKFSKNNSNINNNELNILINNDRNDDNYDNNNNDNSKTNINDNFYVIDEALNELYEVVDERTMMIVLTQGDISSLVELLSRKQRYVRINVYAYCISIHISRHIHLSHLI